jgi:hypothetical protein
VLALLDDRVLVVVDSVTGLTPASTVQIHFHLDSLQVTWDAANRRALTRDEDVQLALYSSGGMQGELLPGRISDASDVARPSTRLRLFDQGGMPDRIHATVLVPTRAGMEFAPVRDLTITPATHTCAFTQAGRSYHVRFGPQPDTNPIVTS